MSWFKHRKQIPLSKARTWNEAERIDAHNRRLKKMERNKRIKHVVFERALQHERRHPRRRRRKINAPDMLNFEPPSRWL